jgi:hypothetical protein
MVQHHFVGAVQQAGVHGPVQRVDQRGAVLQHGALVDRALVGDLAPVDGGRLGQHVQARHPVGAAGGVAPQAVASAWKKARTAGGAAPRGSGASAAGRPGAAQSTRGKTAAPDTRRGSGR